MQAFIDLNCPFCYALSEWIDEAALGNNIDWRIIDHNPTASFQSFSTQALSELTEEIFTIRQREESLPIQLPFGRPNVRKAERLLIDVMQNYPDKFLSLKSALYKAYWVRDLNIENEEVLQNLLTENDLPEIEPDKNLDRIIETWTAEWDQGPYNRRIPVIQKSTSDICLGLPPKAELLAYIKGTGSTPVEQNESCQYEARANVAIHGNWQSMWTLLQEIRSTYDVLFYPNLAELAKSATGTHPPDAVIYQCESLSQNELNQLQSLGETMENHQIPFMITTSLMPAHQELQLLEGAIADIFIDRSIAFIYAKLAKHIVIKKAMNKLSHKSMTDSLTGIANRRSGLTTLEQEWARASRTKLPLSLILIDIDYFKLFNDHYGHLAGDGCLRKIAQVFSAQISRKGDTICRYGGEEFLLFLPDTPVEGAQTVANKILEAVNLSNIEHSNTDLGRVSVSMGISTQLYSSEMTLNKLIDITDQQLYRAKEDGRNLFRTAEKQT